MEGIMKGMVSREREREEKKKEKWKEREGERCYARENKRMRQQVSKRTLN